MGYPLYREVKDHAPGDLPPTELLLLLLLADSANDKSRLSFATRDELVRWMRMSTWDSVQKTLHRLATRKLEVRVPIGTDRAGRSVFARVGQRSTYKIPKFASVDATSLRADDHPPHLLTPHGLLISLVDLPLRLVHEAAVVTVEDERDLIDWITRTHTIHGGGWWRTVARNGDLAVMATAWRADPRRYRPGASPAEMATRPPRATSAGALTPAGCPARCVIPPASDSRHDDACRQRRRPRRGPAARRARRAGSARRDAAVR